MKKKICVRIDDVCPTMDFVWNKKTIELIESYGVKGLLGVVPDCHTDDLEFDEYNNDFWDYMCELEKRGWEIAIHGYTHNCDKKYIGYSSVKKTYSEFAGATLEEQLSMIKDGKKRLEEKGLHPKVFFAPSHNFDMNTITSLKTNGIYCISDGWGRVPFSWFGGILFIPAQGKNSMTIVLHPSSHKNRQEEKYKRIAELLEENKDYLCSYSDILKTYMNHTKFSFVIFIYNRVIVWGYRLLHYARGFFAKLCAVRIRNK